MFKSSQKGSPLCLIDFGSGTMSGDEEVQIDSLPKPCKQSNGDVLSLFTTFAGSAFYISPEMFQRCYTSKTDVWSAGVTLYVLAAGYPFKDLQRAFNILQTSKNSSDRIQQIKSLPNMPDMPLAFYEMLEQALTFRHAKRMDAGSLLTCNFLENQKDGRSEIWHSNGICLDRKDSTVIEGLAFRHKDMHNYAGYEIAVSTLIASVLTRYQLKQLLEKIDQVIQSSAENHTQIEEDRHSQTKSLTEIEEFVNKKRLQVLRLKELKSILKELKFDNV
jgi:Serine/threonine protein kinase